MVSGDVFLQTVENLANRTKKAVSADMLADELKCNIVKVYTYKSIYAGLISKAGYQSVNGRLKKNNPFEDQKIQIEFEDYLNAIVALEQKNCKPVTKKMLATELNCTNKKIFACDAVYEKKLNEAGWFQFSTGWKNSKKEVTQFLSALEILAKEANKAITMADIASHLHIDCKAVLCLRRRYAAEIAEAGWLIKPKIGWINDRFISKSDCELQVHDLISKLDEPSEIESEPQKAIIPDSLDLNLLFQRKLSATQNPNLGKELIEFGMWCIKTGSSMISN